MQILSRSYRCAVVRHSSLRVSINLDLWCATRTREAGYGRTLNESVSYHVSYHGQYVDSVMAHWLANRENIRAHNILQINIFYYLFNTHLLVLLYWIDDWITIIIVLAITFYQIYTIYKNCLRLMHARNTNARRRRRPCRRTAVANGRDFHLQYGRIQVQFTRYCRYFSFTRQAYLYT